jgi:hypothetical protein
MREPDGLGQTGEGVDVLVRISALFLLMLLVRLEQQCKYILCLMVDQDFYDNSGERAQFE